MALNDLTLASPLGVKGRPFRSKIEGLTAGTDVTADLGFGVLNGVLAHPSLPNVTETTVRITERVPETGETKTTPVDIEIYGWADVRARALELLPDGETLERYGSFPSQDADGSFDWNVKAYDDDGERFTDALVDDGGGSFPGSIAYADIRNGTYSYGGNELSDILTENASMGSFSESCILLGIGLSPWGGPNQPTLGSALTADMLAEGFTMYGEVYLTAGALQIEVTKLPGFGEDIAYSVATNQSNTTITVNFDSETAPPYDIDPGVGLHRFAVTYDGTTAKLCVDGGSVISIDASGLDLLNTIGFPQTGVISQLAIYPVNSDAEMQALCDLDRASLPEFTADPEFSAPPQVGVPLTISGGTLSNGGTVYLKQWLDQSLVPAVTGNGYTPDPAAEGSSIYCAVFAENAAGYVYKLVISDPVLPA